METPNRRFGIEAVGRFLADERGTSLTEFVLTLPVFLIIFSGVLQLSRLLHEGVRVKARASKSMWEKALDIHNSGPTSVTNLHTQPIAAGGDSISKIQSHSSPNGDGWAMMKNGPGGLINNGTEGEASQATNILSNNPGPGVPSPSGSAPNQTPGDFPETVIDDSSFNQVGTGPSALNAFTASAGLSATGPNPAVFAGSRYGMVVGEDQETVNIGGRSYDMSAGYDVLVSPEPLEGGFLEENFAVGLSRLAAEDDDCLSEVLIIGIEFGYIGNCL
jgi:hypothetical protein